jgi:hypothetical protein
MDPVRIQIGIGSVQIGLKGMIVLTMPDQEEMLWKNLREEQFFVPAPRNEVPVRQPALN